MSKYSLVCSYKNPNGRLEEFVIKELNGEKLSSLVKIDRFTSERNKLDIFRMIKETYGVEVSKINNLLIKFKKWNSDEYDYWSVIVSDDKYNKAVKNARKFDKQVSILEKIRDTEFVSHNDELYKEEFNKLMTMINDGTFANFYFDNKNDLSELVNMYKKCNDVSEEEMREKRRLKELIALEFSRYKTFRGWYIQSKRMRLNYQIANNRRNNNTVENKKVVVATFDENMKDFDNRFESEYNMTYSQYMTQKHNSGDIYPNPYREFEPEEEFFTEEEFEKSYLGVREVEEEFNNRGVQRRRR